MPKTTVEWIVLPGNVTLVATDTRQTWRFPLAPSMPFAFEMTGPGSAVSTAALLNEAVALGFGESDPVDSDEIATLPQYVYGLVSSYHNARRTPRNYRAAAQQFRSIGRPEVAEYLEVHALEETGHDRLIVKDLEALGLPAQKVLSDLVPEGAKILVDLFDAYSFSNYPMGCIGYSYCFEYSAALKPKSLVDATQALCPPGVDASRFLRTHSSLGSEVGHVEDLIAVIAGLPARDRIEVVKAAYETARQTSIIRREARQSDDAILAQLAVASGRAVKLPDRARA